MRRRVWPTSGLSSRTSIKFARAVTELVTVAPIEELY
jgi:hypothetical protein